MPDQMFAGHFAGQPWRVTLDGRALRDLPNLPEHDPEPDSLSRAAWDAHVALVREVAAGAHTWLRAQVVKVAPIGGQATIREFLERLEYADRVYEVVEIWEEFYDWADRERVWVDTL